MATSFTVRTASKSGRATIIARVQRPEIKLDLRLSTNLQIDADRWNSAKGNKRTSKNLRNAEETTFRKLDEIEKALDSASKNGLSSKDARLIIDSIVYREVREAEQKALEEKKAAIKAQEEAAQSMCNIIQADPLQLSS